MSYDFIGSSGRILSCECGTQLQAFVESIISLNEK